jgi:hypothetical protein
MPDPDPFVENPRQRPYECLGISPSASFEDAQEKARSLHGKHQAQAKKHKGSDPDARDRHMEAINNVKKALETIKERDGPDQSSTTREQLSIELVDDDILVDEPALFVIKEGDGDRSNGAKLEHDGRTERTDRNGEVEMTFRSAGEVTVRATKSGDYLAAEESYDVVDETQLRIQAVDDLTVGPTEFRVTDSEGTPIDGARVAVQGRGGDSATTSGGTARLDLGPSDDTVVAQKADEGGVTYRDASLSIDVGKRQVQLSVEPRTDDPVLGEPTEFVVREEEDTGDPVPGAAVKVKGADGQERTDDDGTATLQIDRENPTVGAAKQDTQAVSYNRGTCSPEFRKRTEEMQVSGPDTVTVGQSVSVTVADGDGNSLGGATVEATNAPLGPKRTGPNGDVSFTFEVDPETTVTLRAEHETELVDYGSATHQVTVEERDRSLSIVSYEKQPTVGEATEFVVKDETGAPVENATLKGVPCGGEEVTDSSGRATLRFENPIPSEVTAYTDDDTIDEEYSVTVTPQP